LATIRDYYISATHIIIRDDNCCKPEDVDIILKRISEQVTKALYAEEIYREDKKN
jgi:hypothetical protein